MLSTEEYKEINGITKAFDIKITAITLVIMFFSIAGGVYLSKVFSQVAIIGLAISIPFWAVFWLYSQTIKYFKKLVDAEYKALNLEKELGITRSALHVLRSLQSLEKREG